MNHVTLSYSSSKGFTWHENHFQGINLLSLCLTPRVQQGAKLLKWHFHSILRSCRYKSTPLKRVLRGYLYCVSHNLYVYPETIMNEGGSGFGDYETDYFEPDMPYMEHIFPDVRTIQWGCTYCGNARFSYRIIISWAVVKHFLGTVRQYV